MALSELLGLAGSAFGALSAVNASAAQERIAQQEQAMRWPGRPRLGHL